MTRILPSSSNPRLPAPNAGAAPSPATLGMPVSNSGTVGRPTTTWWVGRPLAEGKNAHRTNTRAQLNVALNSECNWLEGDVRKELHGGRLEMRHDVGAETGDNLTLDEWLKAGKASGRGLKLDVKEPEHMDAIVRAVKAANIPSERLMWNLGDGAMGAWAAALRRDFPRSTLAINPTGGAESDAKITSIEVARMLALAKRGGAPIAFVVRYDRLTDSAIRALKSTGAVSVWNHVGRAGVSRDNIAQLTADLRARGVDGVIDLQPSYNLVDKIEYKLDQGKNAVGELVHDAFDKLRRN